MAFPLTDEEHRSINARIEALPELIVAAAVRVTADHLSLPVILFSERPGRHGNVIWPAGQLSGDRMRGGEHGFITSRGRFVDRTEAAEMVLASGQGSPRDFGPGYPLSLFSEDMWNESFKGVAEASAGRAEPLKATSDQNQTPSPSVPGEPSR